MYKFTLTQKIVFAAVLAAVCIALKTFLKFDALGVRISFTYIPNFLAGIFLGPVYGMAVGCIGDLCGTLINPSLGALNPFILLGNTLMGGLMGLVFHYSYVKNVYLKIIAGAFCVLVICTYGINTVAQIVPPLSRYATYIIALSARIPQALVVAINTALVIALYFALDRAFFIKYRTKKK